MIDKKHKRITAVICALILCVGAAFFLYKGHERRQLQERQMDRVRTLEQLRALPYATWSEVEVKDEISGVVQYDRRKVVPGYNLYTDFNRTARLMDMEGNSVHTWTFPRRGQWDYVELLDDGGIIAIMGDKALARIGLDSNVVWIRDIPVHHDVLILSDGTYLAPLLEPPVQYNLRNVIFDSLVHLSESGEILDKWATSANKDKIAKHHLPILLDFPPDKIEGQIQDRSERRKMRPFRLAGRGNVYTYYHLNAIEILPKNELGNKDDRFREGNYLVCLRNVDLILILDKVSKEIVWSWGPGVLDRPHTPTMLENGNILIFDNGTNRRYSKILEINPLDKTIVWEYMTEPLEDFFSGERGSSQRLSNGNTLICESDRGRAFEITPQKEIVWEFVNPHRRGRRPGAMYRMERITDHPGLKKILDKQP